MTISDSRRDEIARKRKQALAKVCSLRRDFEKKKNAAEADFEKARSVWNEMSERLP